MGGGLTDGPAGIRPQGCRAELRRHRCGRPAAGTARHIIDMPGIAGGKISRVLRGRPHGELIHVGLADDHGMGLGQFFHHCGIVLRDKIIQDFRSAGGAQPFGTQQVFQGHGDTGERTMIARRNLTVRRSGPGQRVRRVHGDKTLEGLVVGLDTGQKRPGQLRGRDFPFAQQPGRLSQAQCMQIHSCFLFRLFYHPGDQIKIIPFFRGIGQRHPGARAFVGHIFSEHIAHECRTG